MDSLPIAARQAQLNASTQGQWSTFADHRRRIEQLLIGCLPEPSALLLPNARRQPVLGVLGAGNCNDLDLNWLLARCQPVYLYDIDLPALRQAVVRQRVDSDRLLLRAPTDLSGIAHLLDAADRQIDGPTIDTATDAAARGVTLPIEASTNWPGFDLLLSPCVLSQIVSTVRDRLGQDHPHFATLRSALVAGHFRTLLQNLRPGGAALFLTDVISSDTLPQLDQIPDIDLTSELHDLAARRKTFPCLDPTAIANAIDTDPAIAGRWSRRIMLRPWRWRLSPRRTYLVWGLKLIKRA